MSMWNRQDSMDDVINTDYTIIGIIIFSLIGLFSRSPIVFVVLGVLVTYLLLNKYYNKVIQKLLLKNPRQSLRLFPGDQSRVSIEFVNNSLVPIVNGQFSFSVDKAITVLTFQQEDSSSVSLPLSVISKRSALIELPIEANFRGVSKIKNIEYTFPHLLNFGAVNLKYAPFYYTEIIVYPKLKSVYGIEAIFQIVPGEQRTNFSPYEDIQSIVGTRDYHYADPFQRINWKATAKSQQLQTNVYERIVDMSYVFIVNVSVKTKSNLDMMNTEIEAILSSVAYISNYTREQGFPFEMYINIRRPGGVPYIHLHEGSGKNHYLLALETLARIQTPTMVYPFEEMIRRVRMDLLQPKTIIFFGDLEQTSNSIFSQLDAEGHSIYEVKEADSMSVIKRLVKSGVVDE